MNIQDYMTRQRGLIERQSRYVKAYRVFDFSYVPSQPMIRPETKQLVDDLLRFELTGVPSNALILGSRGSGKTLTLKHLCEVMPRQSSLVMRYVNCRHHNTSHRILAHLLGGRCQGLSLGELYERFIDAHAEQRLCLVLDEVDLMSPKDRRREVLYLLSRSETPVMLILLSNNHKVTDQLDAATRSSLQLTTLLFRNYTPDQIESILQARAEAGLRVWDAGSLKQIAALTVRLTHADTRVAIKTLFYLVTRNNPIQAEEVEASEPGKQVNPRESARELTEPESQNTAAIPGEAAIVEAFESARHDIVQDMVQDLSDALLLILRAVVNGESRLAKDTYARYCRFSKEMHEPPFSYVHYYASLAYLQSCGLVALISTKTGRAYTNRVEATFDGKVVEPIVKARFG
jgi:Cdc6-like AAA superfamily ATPase